MRKRGLARTKHVLSWTTACGTALTWLAAPAQQASPGSGVDSSPVVPTQATTEQRLIAPEQPNPSQEIAAPPPTPPGFGPSLAAPGQAGLAGPARGGGFEQGLPASLLSPSQGLTLGRFRLHGGVTGSVAYDDNVQGQSTKSQSDVVWTVSPYGTLTTEGPNARSLLLSYRPSFMFYLDHSDLNSVNHFATFDVHWPLNRLTLGLSENVSAASMVVPDIGGRVMQRTFGTQGSANYEFSDRTSAQGVIRYDVWDYDQPYISSRQWTEQLWLDYHLYDRLTVGAGLAISELAIDQAPSQLAEAPELRLNFTPNPRLKLSASAGLEFRQFDSRVPGTTEPVFRLGASYQLRPGTTFSLEGHRAEAASGLIPGANYVDTGFSAGVSEVLFSKWLLTFGGGYNTADYAAAQAGVNTQRSDSYYFLRAALGYSFIQGWGVGLFYERLANDSNSQFGFQQNIIGLQASWSF
jgi:hypothetical protein